MDRTAITHAYSVTRSGAHACMHTHMREGTHTHGWTDAPHTVAVLACRIRKHFKYLLNKKPVIKEEDLLTQLSPDLKAEVLIHSHNSGGVPPRPKCSREGAQRPRAERTLTSLASPSQLSAAAGEEILARVPFQGLAPFSFCPFQASLFFTNDSGPPAGSSRSGWRGS